MPEIPVVEATGRLYRDVYVIGDIHGSLGGLRAVLEHAGLLNPEGRWIGRRAHVVQCGDVVDRGPDSQACLELLLDLRRQARRAKGRLDVLVGNHELALARGDSSISDLAEPQALGRLLARAIAAGRLHAARSYHHYLMTHAGVNPDLMLWLIAEIRKTQRRVTVASLARYLNQQLKRAFEQDDFSHPMFRVGRSRGGNHDSGGIFWADFEFEHKQQARHPRVWQIFGHTPPNGGEPFRVSPDQRRVNIDVGICGHYGGYHAYVRLLPDRIVGIHCQDSRFKQDVLAIVGGPAEQAGVDSRT